MIKNVQGVRYTRQLMNLSISFLADYAALIRPTNQQLIIYHEGLETHEEEIRGIFRRLHSDFQTPGWEQNKLFLCVLCGKFF